MLTAVNDATKMVQEIMATSHGEMLGAERAAQVSFVDAMNPIPITGPCRCLGVLVFASDTEPATLRVMDGGRSVPIMEAFANIGWWGSFIMPRGVASTGSLVAMISGMNAYGYVYYVTE